MKYALILICLFCSYSLALDSSTKDAPNETAQSNQKTSGDTKEPIKSSFVINIASPYSNKNETGNSSDNKNDSVFYEGLAAWSTFGLAFLTFCLAGATIFLAKYTKGLWDGATEIHTTKFCWMIDPVGNANTIHDPIRAVTHPVDNGGLVFNTIHHNEWNCTDDECDQC
jgi:hypothetical protein